MMLNQTSFDALFRRLYNKMCRFAFTIVNDHDLAEDIVQDVFEKIWYKRKEISIKKTFDDYIFTSVRNSCYEFLRKTIVKEEISDSVLPIYNEQNHELNSQKKKSLWKAISAMPEQRQCVFKLIVLEGYSYNECSVALNISVNTIKTHMKRSYRELRKKLTNIVLFFVSKIFKY